MRLVVGALCVAVLAAAAPPAQAEEPGLRLGVGGFYSGSSRSLLTQPDFAFGDGGRERALYRGMLGPLELSASLDGREVSAEAAADKGKARLLSAGLQLSYGGFLGDLTYDFGVQGRLYDGKRHRFAAGLRYSLSSLSVGSGLAVNWQQERGSSAHRFYSFELGANYSLAPGVDAVGSLQHTSPQRGRGALKEDKGAAGLFGVVLSF